MTKLFKQMMAALAIAMFVSSSLVGAAAVAQDGGDSMGTSGTGSSTVHHAKKKTKKKKAKKSAKKAAKKPAKKAKKSKAHKASTPPAEAPPSEPPPPPMDSSVPGGANSPGAPAGEMGGAGNGAPPPAPSNP